MLEKQQHNYIETDKQYSFTADASVKQIHDLKLTVVVLSPLIYVSHNRNLLIRHYCLANISLSEYCK